MHPIVSLFIVYGFAGALPLGAIAAALGLAAHHRRRSRIAAYALDPGAPVVEGPALLRGWVEDDEGAPPGPTLAVEVAPSGSGASPKTAWRVRARGFGLRLPGGQTLRVEPEEDGARIRIDQTFHPTWQTGEGALAYTTEIHAGDLVHLEGEVRREIDTRSTGRGYRDAATAWVVRAPAGGALGVVSERMIALHAQRARFHIRWALGLGGAVAALHLGLLASFHAALRALGPAAAVAKLDSMSAVHTAALAVVLVFAYHLSAEGSRPWLDRAVTRS